MANRIAFTPIQTRLWAAAVILFAAASMGGLAFGPKMAHSIAFRFHEAKTTEYLAARDYRRASEELKALVWLEPENRDAVVRVADAYLVQGEWLEARDWLETLEWDASSSAGSDYAFVMAQIALASGSGDASKWLDVARQNANEGDTGLSAELLAAHIARHSGDGAAALQGYNGILAAHPDHAEALHWLAKTELSRLKNGDVARLIRAMNDASREYTYTTEFRRMQAEATLTLRRGDNDVAAGKTIDGKRLETLGLAALELGQWDRAMEFFGRAEAAGGGSGQVEFWLGVNADAEGDRETALAKFRAAVAEQPGANTLAQRNVDRLSAQN